MFVMLNFVCSSVSNIAESHLLQGDSRCVCVCGCVHLATSPAATRHHRSTYKSKSFLAKVSLYKFFVLLFRFTNYELCVHLVRFWKHDPVSSTIRNTNLQGICSHHQSIYNTYAPTVLSLSLTRAEILAMRNKSDIACCEICSNVIQESHNRGIAH